MNTVLFVAFVTILSGPLHASCPQGLNGKSCRVGPPEIYPHADTQPGFADPGVTQGNIAETICSKRWTTDSARPPTSYTTRLKIEQMPEYGDTIKDPNKKCWAHSANPACYEQDHIWSLQNGGHGTDPRNEFPQPYWFYAKGRLAGARQKDLAENWVHDAICFDVPNARRGSKIRPNKSITLSRGQEILSGDWYACYLSLQAGQDCK